MEKEFIFQSDKLDIKFEIKDDQTVELKRFSPKGAPQAGNEDIDISKQYSSEARKIMYSGARCPVVEVQFTGKSTRGMHGFKHNSSSASCDFKYVRHEVFDRADGKELIIYLATDYDLSLDYHLRAYIDVPVVRAWSELRNSGTESWPVEYISSFVYQNVCGDGNKLFFDKTDVYVPYSSWDCEAHWKKEDLEDLNVSRMTADGFNTPGIGKNRFAYTGISSWSCNEYLPMGLTHDRETNETYCFQIESSSQWHIEYDTESGMRLAVLLSGPTEQEHGWWFALKPGTSFTTVPAAFGVVKGGTSEACAALTEYRRVMRRPNADDEKLNVVFNDYMNCLMGDPTEDREKKIIDNAAEIGCEYYCLDCGWYDKGFWWDKVGEWKESRERFPDGLKSVCDYAKSKGMVMGLWLEPEVMGIAYKEANNLPDDWFIMRHGKRHIDNKRYMLDFRNPDVRDYCMDVVDRLINDYGVGYFKIDYNVTMGYGSDLNTDSPSEAMLEHYRALYSWYEEIFRKYPDLVIENCGSGGQRMDYGMLRLLSLQSTSDQTDYIYNSYIAANIASAVTPEQAGMWVYPYEDDEEHVIYNMVNAILLRPYMSGMVWKLSQDNLDLMKEGIDCYKQIRNEIRHSTPFFPMDFVSLKDGILAYGVQNNKHAFLSVWTPKTEMADVPLNLEHDIEKVEVMYPKKANCSFSYENGLLHVEMPQKKAARMFCLTFR